MTKVVVGLTMSLDGYINDGKGSLERLYPDLEELKKTDMMQEEIRNTGAVIMGWNAYAMAENADLYAENYEFQVPLFVLCRHSPEKHPKENDRLTFTFITDGIKSAISQAKKAAGDKNVTIIGGARTARECIKGRLADELQIDVIPVLLCDGLRLFEALGKEPIELEKIKVTETGERTSILFRFVS